MKMKKLLKNAVVYAVAASMLFATPLTASAGLIDAYKVTDGDGRVLSGDEDSKTGTVSSTNTDTTILKDDVDARIVGIALDKSFVSTEVDKHPQLTATVILEGKFPIIIEDEEEDKVVEITEEEVRKLVADQITWRVSKVDGAKSNLNGALYNTLSIEAKADNRSVVTLSPLHGTKDGNLLVTASIGGERWYFDQETGKLKEKEDFEDSEVYEASAEVYIKEYADSYTFPGYEDAENAAYFKHTVDLGSIVVTDPIAANDTISWGTSDSTVATVTAKGVVTFKSKAKTVTITAKGEKKAIKRVTFNVTEGNPANKIEIEKAEATWAKTALAANNKGVWKSGKVDLIDSPNKGDNRDVTVTARITETKKKGESKKDASTENASTDKITWTSKNTKIVEVVTSTHDNMNMSQIEASNRTNDNRSTVTLIPKAVGSSTITAKTTSNKKVTYSLTVKATLQGLKIVNLQEVDVDSTDYSSVKENYNGTKYSGQTLQLGVVRIPAENKTKIKWTLDSEGKKNATVKASTGVVSVKKEIKNATNGSATVVVTATPNVNAEKDKKVDSVITVKQSAVSEINVTDPVTKTVMHVEVNDKSTGVKAQSPKKTTTFELTIPKNRVYPATATLVEPNPADDVKAEETLNWKSSKPKVAAIEYKNGIPTIKALSTGTTTITVSGVYHKFNASGKDKGYAAINVLFKVKVTQPITSLKMKKESVVVTTKTKSKSVTSTVTKTPKKATGDIKWSYTKNDGDATEEASTTKVSKKYTFKDYEAGDEFVVTAKAEKTGAVATSTISIVSQTDKFNVASDANGTAFTSKKMTTLGNDSVGDSAKVYVSIQPKGASTSIAPGAEITTGDTKYKAADVTYKVNKSGIVSVVDEGNGEYTIYRIGTGDAKVTFTTGDGKKYVLTVKK